MTWDFEQPDEPIGISVPYPPGEHPPLSLAVNPRTKLVAVGGEGGGFTLMDSRYMCPQIARGKVTTIKAVLILYAPPMVYFDFWSCGH